MYDNKKICFDGKVGVTKFLRRQKSEISLAENGKLFLNELQQNYLHLKLLFNLVACMTMFANQKKIAHFS